MKRLFCLLFVCILFVGSLSTDAFARADVAAYRLTCSDLPAGTEYVDMLIKLPTTDPCYTPLVTENVPDGFAEDAEIISYCIDNYRSYTFHYNGAVSQIAVGDPKGLSYFDNGVTYAHHMDDVRDRGEIKLAMLDGNGNILKVSGPQSLKPKGVFVRITPDLHYDAQSDTLDVGKESYFFHVLIIFIIILVIMAAHCAVKWVMAQLFDVWLLHEKLIIFTGMTVYILQCAIAYCTFISYIMYSSFVTASLFVLTQAGELALYCIKMKDVSWKRCLAYTLLSNFVSFLVAILLLFIIL